MNKKIVIALIVGTMLVTGGVSFIFARMHTNKIEEELNAQIAGLQSTITAYGTEIPCYTVASSVKAGDVITEDSLVILNKPSTYVTAQDITNSSEIIGKYFKIPLTYGTTLTYDMVMDEDVYDDTKEYDIMVDSWPVGLSVGDYVDIEIVYPYGDLYTVLSKKRVQALNGETLKIHMDKAEHYKYEGAFVDYALNKEYGTTIRAVKYVEPGLQQAAISYYAVPDNIAALIQADPNVVEKTDYAALQSWRSGIDELLAIFRDEDDTVDTDGSKLAEMRDTYNGAVMTDVDANASTASQETTEEDYWSSTPTDVTSDLE